MAGIGEILEKHWGHSAFRPMQEAIINSVLAGQDTLAILPTGGGKSICFQVPALALDGICIVVSPLIALMKDQVDNLKKRGIPALLIHSGMKRNDVIRVLKNATDDYFKFLYVSPERLETRLFREYLPALHVSLVAVDEAHCISQWGYDFRPSYLRIAALRQELPGVPVIALTASATPDVQDDICTQLLFKDKQVFRQSFERKNLCYSAFCVEAKMPRLVEIIKKLEGSAIVYCKSRKRTQEIAQLLQQKGISAGHYHAGMKEEERSRRQKEWIDGTVRVMACTNAFGMGIDKPDVRLVIHADMPDCLENYYQEAGRAGRDGLRSYAVLLYREEDMDALAEQHQVRFPSLETIRNTYRALVNYLQIPSYTGEYQSFDFYFDEFVRNFRLPSHETLYALKALEQDGWIQFNEQSFLPSTLVFTASKASLREFESAYPQHEPLLTTLLRTYEGIFDFPAFIQEKFLARLLRLSEPELKTQLQTIASFGMISYTPQNETPQLVFCKHRVPAEELSFNWAPYEKRKQRFIERAAAMTGYARSTACRSRIINHYFGDTEAQDCGICDNCLQKRSGKLSGEEFGRISGIIRNRLQHGPLSPAELLRHDGTIGRQKAWQVIEFLQAEKKIRIGDDGLLSWQEPA